MVLLGVAYLVVDYFAVQPKDPLDMFGASVDALTLVLALSIYKRQAVSCVRRILSFRHCIEISSRKVSELPEPEQESIFLWDLLANMFWGWIVERMPGWVYSRTGDKNRRWVITGLFILITTLGWIGMLLLFGLASDISDWHSLMVWIWYTFYLGIVTALAIPFSMAPPTN